MFVCVQALPLLGAVGGVMLMFLLMFSVAAVQIFTSVFHNVCMGPDPEGSGQVSILQEYEQTLVSAFLFPALYKSILV